MRVVIGIKKGILRKVTLCSTIGRSKSLATGLRMYGYEVRILSAEEVLKLTALPEQDSEVRISRAKKKFKEQTVAHSLKMMRSPSRMAQ